MLVDFQAGVLLDQDLLPAVDDYPEIVVAVVFDGDWRHYDGVGIVQFLALYPQYFGFGLIVGLAVDGNEAETAHAQDYISVVDVLL